MNNDKVNALNQEIGGLIQNAECNSSVVIGSTDGTMWYQRQANEIVPTASVSKVAVLAVLLKLVQEGELLLKEKLEIKVGQKTVGSGVLRNFQYPIEISIHDLANLMITISDNLATNVLIEAMSLSRISQVLKSWGVDGIEIRNPVSPNALKDPNDFAVGTAFGFFDLISKIESDRILDQHHKQLFFQLLGDLRYVEPLRRDLPFTPYWMDLEGVSKLYIYGKTGALPGVRAGLGIYELGSHKWCISAFFTELRDTRSSFDNYGFKLLSDLVSRTFEKVCNA